MQKMESELLLREAKQFYEASLNNYYDKFSLFKDKQLQ